MRVKLEMKFFFTIAVKYEKNLERQMRGGLQRRETLLDRFICPSDLHVRAVRNKIGLHYRVRSLFQ